LREFVESGGGLVATYETSLYDEWGVRRKDFGLGELFGVTYAGRVDENMLNSNLTIERDPAANGSHLLVRGFEDSVRIINAVNQVHVAAVEQSNFTPLRIIPSYPDLPMESLYPRRGEHPRSLFAKRWQEPRRLFPRRHGSNILGGAWRRSRKLLRNAVEWATNEAPAISVEAKSILDIAVWEQQDSMTIHLVNLTNPMMMKRPVREIIPVPSQKVSFRVPDGRRVRRVRLLVSGVDIPHRTERDDTFVEIPAIGLHEVIATDFSPSPTAGQS
jgi:hypothetical protein